ncbi:MAG: nucleoside triphosphate pyrophosphohydrolase [Streptococcaceae bacterium]|jgi:predicted house-cleaning noncanonical NTP pyrophosphatase (MazG superfamily)|nr:nucleoside triphosphate pyrophosphohydrolase [Streptococcaceae bacterium]
MKTFMKLVRDRIPEIIEAAGKTAEFEILNSAQFAQELDKKLLEEVAEVVEAADKTSKVEELADLLEVIYAIAENSEISLEEIEKVRLSKREERGGFDRRIWLKSVS